MNDYVTQANTYMALCDNRLSVTWDGDTLSWYVIDFGEEKEPDIMSPKKSLERMKFGMEK
jgi:hypothetical protein